jgi:predicted DNA-binding transcriptional regulator YafY
MLASTVRQMIEPGKSYLMVYETPEGDVSERVVDVSVKGIAGFAGNCRLRAAFRSFCYDRVLGCVECANPDAWRWVPFMMAERREGVAA